MLLECILQHQRATPIDVVQGDIQASQRGHVAQALEEVLHREVPARGRGRRAVGHTQRVQAVRRGQAAPEVREGGTRQPAPAQVQRLQRWRLRQFRDDPASLCRGALTQPGVCQDDIFEHGMPPDCRGQGHEAGHVKLHTAKVQFLKSSETARLRTEQADDDRDGALPDVHATAEAQPHNGLSALRSVRERPEKRHQRFLGEASVVCEVDLLDSLEPRRHGGDREHMSVLQHVA
mmetsp:Transcript_74610/g.242334  ORF Transcript_74610/g.242334 Transcript_74610/m.242334 type:complete len:234 (+) Transcript_74610:2376-3077(+)